MPIRDSRLGWAPAFAGEHSRICKRFTRARYDRAMPDAYALATALLRPLGPLFVLGSQFYWPTYLGAAGVAAALYVARRRRGFRPRALIRHLLPARIVRHPSSWLDFKLFLIALVYLALQAPVQIAAALLTFRGVQGGFDLLLGPGEIAGTPSLAVTAGSRAHVPRDRAGVLDRAFRDAPGSRAVGVPQGPP